MRWGFPLFGMTEVTDKKIPWIDRAWQKIANVLGILLIIAGFIVIGFQVIVYLLYGDWIELSLLDLAQSGPYSFVVWLYNPTSWIGLHKITFWVLDFTPISVFLILVGLGFALHEAETPNNADLPLT